jgi:hypothetical protein
VIQNLQILPNPTQLGCTKPYKRKMINIKINAKTLVTRNPDTRLSPMCPGKKLFGHLHQALTHRCNQIL